MKTKNWKTTWAAIIGAVLICAASLIVNKGKIDAPTFAVAAVVAVVGVLASDANVENTIKESPIAASALDIADLVVTRLAAANPNTELLQTLHGKIDELQANVAALPEATAAAIPAPVIVETAPAEEAPAAEAAQPEAKIDLSDPNNWKFDPLTGNKIV